MEVPHFNLHAALLVGLLGLASATAGCATTGNRASNADESVAEAATTPAEAGAKPVQVVKLDGADVQGQTTWQIRPTFSLLPGRNGKSGQSPAIAPHIDQRLQYAFDLAQRGAVYSAYAEFQNVIGLCAAELDAAEGGSKRRKAAQEGFVALEEVEEFGTSRDALRSREINVKRISAAHRTPLQERIENEDWDAGQATRNYYEFAMQRIDDACRGSTAAPNALYGMGRTAGLLSNRTPHGALRAMLLYDLTLRVDPTHALAANELGVLLAQNGRFEDAERALALAVTHGDSAESWKNLAMVYQRLGKSAESHQALQRALAPPPADGPASTVLASSEAKPPIDPENAPDERKFSETAQAKGDGKPAGQTVAAEGLRQNLLRLFRR